VALFPSDKGVLDFDPQIVLARRQPLKGPRAVPIRVVGKRLASRLGGQLLAGARIADSAILRAFVF